jgi:hypothetical protein
VGPGCDEFHGDGGGVRRPVLTHAEEVERRAPLVILKHRIGSACKQCRDKLDASSCMQRGVQRRVPVAIHCSAHDDDIIREFTTE